MAVFRCSRSQFCLHDGKSGDNSDFLHGVSNFDLERWNDSSLAHCVLSINDWVVFLLLVAWPEEEEITGEKKRNARQWK